MPRHVIIIGAGVIGAVSAIEALRDGNRVTIIEPGEPGGEQAASYGNAGWFSSHSVIPPAEPGVWKKVPGYLMDPLGPLAIRWRHLPRAASWLFRYLRSGWTAADIDRTARALRPLLENAPLLHAKLAEEASISHLVERAGVLHAYPSREAFEADALAWAARRKVGIEWLELDHDELRQREPALHPRYRFAAMVEEAGRCLDPGAYVAALVALAKARGAVLVRSKATGFRRDGDRLAAVTTEEGEVACDVAVIAAGIRSKPLAASLGDKLPLETERGYHAMVEGFDIGLRHAVMVSDVKVFANPMANGLRSAGQVEIAGVDAEPDWKRAEILRDGLVHAFPGLPEKLPPGRVKFWMGHRPSMPDGRPCIGFSRATQDVIYAFGHGHIGLVSSARTGRVVAQLIGGRNPEIPLEPFDPGRFL